MILGLDISTSITGFCILDGEGEIIRANVWDTRNKNKFGSFQRRTTRNKGSVSNTKGVYRKAFYVLWLWWFNSKNNGCSAEI